MTPSDLYRLRRNGYPDAADKIERLNAEVERRGMVIAIIERERRAERAAKEAAEAREAWAKAALLCAADALSRGEELEAIEAFLRREAALANPPSDEPIDHCGWVSLPEDAEADRALASDGGER